MRPSELVRAGRLPRPLAQRLQAEQAEGLVSAARVEAAAHTTHVALRLTAALSAEEGLLIGLAPLGEERYRLLVNQFTAVAAAELARLGW
jgi:DNA-binding HxlR family transcriptional regulator